MREYEDMRESRSEILRSILINRRSVRQFAEMPLRPEHLKIIIEAGIYAPSGSNSQNQRFLVIENAEEKTALGSIRYVWPYPTAEKVRKKKPAGLIGGAATVIVVFADASLNDHRNNGEYYIWEPLEIQNCAASIENMLNMATALGVGSCWLSASEYMTRTRLLNKKSWATALSNYDVPPWYKIQGVVILGYPRRELNADGFPKGDKEHGASIWASTARKEIDYYLIGKRTAVPETLWPLSNLQNLKLRVLSRSSGLLLKLIKVIDKNIYNLEVRQVLSNVYRQQKESKE